MFDSNWNKKLFITNCEKVVQAANPMQKDVLKMRSFVRPNPQHGI